MWFVYLLDHLQNTVLVQGGSDQFLPSNGGGEKGFARDFLGGEGQQIWGEKTWYDLN